MACDKLYQFIENSKKVIQAVFGIASTIQGIVLVVVSAWAISLIWNTNISVFVSFDILSLLCTIIILEFIVVVVGWIAAIANQVFIWAVYHLLIVILLFIEVLISISIRDVSVFLNIVDKNWAITNEGSIGLLQENLICCGLHDLTDHPVEPCPVKATNSCYSSIAEIFQDIKYVSTVMAVVFIIVTSFIDVSGFALCCHPEFVSEDLDEPETSIDSDNYGDFAEPFPI